jgi:hypothetical protein
MKPTLESMLVEMRSSFEAIHTKIDDVDARLCQKIDEGDSHLNERIDRIVLRMDIDRKENESRFRDLDLRFDRLPAELAAYLGPFINTVEKMLDNHDKRIDVLEQRA